MNRRAIRKILTAVFANKNKFNGIGYVGLLSEDDRSSVF